MQLFYANLTVTGNVISSRVNGVEICMSSQFTVFLEMPQSGLKFLLKILEILKIILKDNPLIPFLLLFMVVSR